MVGVRSLADAPVLSTPDLGVFADVRLMDGLETPLSFFFNPLSTAEAQTLQASDWQAVHVHD